VDLSNGARLGPYEVLAPLGAGGMGEVYLAQDTRLGRRVAIKRLLKQAASDVRVSHQLFQEARAAAALTHPHIATIHDVIEFEDAPMIVMEYVPGESLDALLRSRRPTIDDAINWTLQIADALGAAHAHDVIHCDIKPANVRLTPDGIIKVLDFGVARIRSLKTAGISSPQHPTQATTAITPTAVGTPPYMAPEQFLSQAVDPRTDLYALGVVLFEMLAGRRPFDAPDTVGISLQVLSGDRPSLVSLNPAVPKALADVVSRAMARLPAERFASASAMSDALRRAQVAIAETPSTSTPKPRRRGTLVIAVAAVAAITIVAGLGPGRRWFGAVTPTSRVSQAGDEIVAVLPLTNLSGDSQDDSLSAGITAIATTKLAALPAARVLASSATAGYRDGSNRVDRVAHDLGATLVVEGSLQRNGDRLQVTANLVRASSRAIVWSGAFNAPVADIFNLQRQLTDGLIQGLQTAGALSGPLTPQDRTRLANPPTANADAFADYSQGRSFLERQDVAANLDRAATLFGSAVSRDPSFAIAHAALGETFWLKYQNSKEEAWIAKAREETLEALRLDPDQAGVRYSLAVIYNGTGKTTEAVQELKRAIALQPASDDAHRLLGEIVARQGQLDDAVVELRRAIDLRPSYWSNHWSLGLAYYNAGRYEEAIEALKRVVELQPDNARGFQTLGTAYHQTNDLTNALTNYQRAIELNPSAAAYSNIGTIHFTRGEFAEAARAYESAAGLAPQSAATHRNLANAFEAMGDDAKARAAYLKARDLTSNALRVNPGDARTLALRAYCEAKVGAKSDAQRDIDNALKLAPADKEVLYKNALIKAIASDDAGALKALSEALAHGYSAPLVTTDREWLRLQSSPEFQRLVTPR
jgi:serine/threonine protein kinase/tetratricopeptide (TPR) repeat protein